MICRATERSNPPFRGSQCWGVDSECLIVGVPGGGGFQTAHVRAVTQFCLRIATDDFVFFRAFKEEFVLLGGALFPESYLDNDRRGQVDSCRGIQSTYQEHAGVQTIRSRFTDQVIGRMEIFH